jgi:putative oxidoreductase
MSGTLTLRSEWQPRVLSIVRIVAGLLYLQHGLNKMLNFPPTPTHVPYAENMFSLVPGVAGLIAGAFALSPRPLISKTVPSGQWKCCQLTPSAC